MGEGDGAGLVGAGWTGECLKRTPYPFALPFPFTLPVPEPKTHSHKVEGEGEKKCKKLVHSPFLSLPPSCLQKNEPRSVAVAATS